MGVWFCLRTAQGVVCPHCRATHKGEALIWLLVVVEITPHSDCKIPREREREKLWKLKEKQELIITQFHMKVRLGSL